MNSDKHNIVCISTIDWDFIWQGHQEIMSTMARQGHRVLFIENTGVRNVGLRDLPRLKNRLANWRKGIRGIRKVMDNLYAYAPLVLPFPYSRIARFINKAMMFWTLRSWTKSMGFADPIIWTWLPTPLALELIEFLNGRLVVYYCCGDLQASSSGSRKIRETEDVLLQKADIVFAHSKALYDRCRRFNDQVHVFQYGFNRTIFACADDRPPPDLECIKRPILGYVGGVHRVLDFELLKKVALAHPDKSLVFVGPRQVDAGQLAGLPNVYFLGQKRYEELPTYIRHFDLGLIPYVLNAYTRSVYPNKLNEYLIMGKPVISTRLPEVEFFNHCHQGIVSIADGHEEFVARITEELKADSEARRLHRISMVEKNAWSEKIEAMTGLIQAKLDEKAKSREVNWHQVFLRMSRPWRHRLAGVAVTGALAYAVMFHTPAFWMLAKPLLVVEQPVQADAIVVLAAGIGESGVPGEAYQEKVKRAVELYRKGYANALIFSSGVAYVFEEAQVMKALAVSLGIPESAILLDERGGGNYTSLLNVKRIMDSRHWTRMLLVTSRYNGTRSRLIAEKNLPGYSVTLTPAENSVFFGDERHVLWRHITAVTHEYASVVYYWLKGYI